MTSAKPAVTTTFGAVTLSSPDIARDLTLGDLEDLVLEARRKGCTSRSEIRMQYNTTYLRDEIAVRTETVIA